MHQAQAECCVEVPAVHEQGIQRQIAVCVRQAGSLWRMIFYQRVDNWCGGAERNPCSQHNGGIQIKRFKAVRCDGRREIVVCREIILQYLKAVLGRRAGNLICEELCEIRMLF